MFEPLIFSQLLNSPSTQQPEEPSSAADESSMNHHESSLTSLKPWFIKWNQLAMVHEIVYQLEIIRISSISMVIRADWASWISLNPSLKHDLTSWLSMINHHEPSPRWCLSANVRTMPWWTATPREKPCSFQPFGGASRTVCWWTAGFFGG